MSTQGGLQIGLCVLEREGRGLERNRDPRSHTYSWEKMSCFGCFKPEKKMPSRRMESREITVVKKVPSQNEAPPKESGKNHKMFLQVLANRNKELECFVMFKLIAKKRFIGSDVGKQTKQLSNKLNTMQQQRSKICNPPIRPLLLLINFVAG